MGKLDAQVADAGSTDAGVDASPGSSGTAGGGCGTGDKRAEGASPDVLVLLLPLVLAVWARRYVSSTRR